MKQAETVHKTAFDDVMANSASWSCYDLSYILCDEISRLLIQADSGELSDPRGLLDGILTDFSAAIKMLVYPALDALSVPDADDEAVAKSITGAGPDENEEEEEEEEEDEISIEEDEGEDMAESAESDREKLASFNAAKTFFTWKPKGEEGGTVASKKATKLVKKDATGPGEESDPWQEVHDYSLSLGANCMHIEDESLTSTTSSSFDPKKIKNQAVKKFISTLQKENKELADAAEAATRLLEQVLKQPLA